MAAEARAEVIRIKTARLEAHRSSRAESGIVKFSVGSVHTRTIGNSVRPAAIAQRFDQFSWDGVWPGAYLE